LLLPARELVRELADVPAESHEIEQFCGSLAAL
jgi:hypothetical protein